MSASSWLVTCGIITQLRCRFAAEIFLIRDSGLTSIGPNFAKSTFGQGNRSKPTPPPAGAAGETRAGADEAPIANAATSSFRIRPLVPVPLTRPRSTPSCRASARAPGPA